MHSILLSLFDGAVNVEMNDVNCEKEMYEYINIVQHGYL